ncbi:MAG: insulinase family protein, partial [Actinomycetota bacterium]
DPNIVRTYEVFDSAVTEVQKGEIDPDKLKEAILSACGEVDPLQSPDTKGRQRFFNDIAGYTLEIQEEFKKGLLAVTEEDLRRVAGTYLTGNTAVLATLAGASMIEEANKQMGEIFEVSPLT